MEILLGGVHSGTHLRQQYIHKNSKLATVDKFNYLNSLLDKIASEAIAGIAITEANYEEAIAILKSRLWQQTDDCKQTHG